MRGLLALAQRAVCLKGSDWGRYLDDSRILERTAARLRLALRGRENGAEADRGKAS